MLQEDQRKPASKANLDRKGSANLVRFIVSAAAEADAREQICGEPIPTMRASRCRMGAIQNTELASGDPENAQLQ